MKTPKCCECEYARETNIPRHGTAGSWRVGTFAPKEYACNHPRHFSLFGGKTSPKSCPLREKNKKEG